MDGAKKRILCVDDDTDNCEMLTRYLELRGYVFVSASNGADAIRFAGGERFDAYVLDNWMPDVTGVEICKRIRAFDPDTPIIFYSAAVRESDHQEAMKAGAQAYINRPGNLEELERIIQSLLGD
jgi:CheY-like chemotaxis protein